MSKTWKRISALFLAGAMALSLAACGGDQKKTDTDGIMGAELVTGEEKIFTEPTSLNVVIGSHVSWPYDENWVMWKYFEEATGADFQIQAIPNEDINTKVSLMMASPDTLPDLMHIIDKRIADANALAGAFVELSEENVPNLYTYLDTLDDEIANEWLMQRKSGDGKVYFAPVFGTERVTNVRTWMYRKDIFEANGLAVPTTEDEIYTVSKKLKEIYPESYPLCFRNGLDQINVMGPMWKNDFRYDLYYDFKTEEWKYGAQDSETMKHIIEFFHKMSAEELVPPDFLTISTNAWQELVSTNRGFIMPEYIVRIDHFNKICRPTDPEYTWAIMAPPVGGTPNGQSRIGKYNVDPSGYLVCNTGKTDSMSNALKVVNWLYSDYGSELMSWGKEGETYEVVDGKKQFIVGENETAQELYGVNTYGITLRADPDAVESAYSEEQCEQGRICGQYIETFANPTIWLALNDEETKIYQTYFEAVKTYADEMLSKFLLKLEPMSKWDEFQAGLVEVGVNNLLEIHTSAYNRVK